jgi:hypothetical protein
MPPPRPANPQALGFRRDLHNLQPVELALGHRAELAEDGVLVLGDAPVDDPSQLEGDRTGLAPGQVIQSGLLAEVTATPLAFPWASWDTAPPRTFPRGFTAGSA